MKSSERVRERVTAALEDGLSVRDKHALDRQVEQRPQRPPQPGVSRSLGQPGLRTEAEAAALGAEDYVPWNECAVLWQPAHDLGAAGGGESLRSAREWLAGPEDVGYRPRPSLDGGTRAARSPESAAVAPDDVGRASRVPEDSDEDVHRPPRALDVAVEHPPEQVGLVGRDERIDQQDGVGRLPINAADVLLPLGVPGRPAPKRGGDLEYVHGC